MNKTKPEPIANILKDVFVCLEKNLTGEDKDVFKAWDKIAGRRIKMHTRLAGFKNDKLIINTESSCWLFELKTKHKERLLKRLKKEVGRDKIKDIKFNIGEIRNVG